MQSEPSVDLTVAVGAIRSADSFWRVLLSLTALDALSSTVPSEALWLAVPFLLMVPLNGYQLSISRAVIDEQDALPPFASRFRLMMRRGLASFMIVGAPSLAAGMLFVVGGHVLASADVPFLGLIAQALLATLLFAALTLVLAFMPAQYIATERLRDGFGYRTAWRQFQLHAKAGRMLLGYWLGGTLLFLVLQYGVLALFGLDISTGRFQAIGQMMRSSMAEGVALVGAYLLIAVLGALWLLVSGHLVGQYANVAYPSEQVRGSV